MESQGSRCKIVVVGDTQCGKTALLHVFAKDCYPEVSVLIYIIGNGVLRYEHECQHLKTGTWII